MKKVRKTILSMICAVCALAILGCKAAVTGNEDNGNVIEDFEIPNSDHPFRKEYPIFTSQLDNYIRTFFTYQTGYTTTIIDNDIHCKLNFFRDEYDCIILEISRDYIKSATAEELAQTLYNIYDEKLSATDRNFWDTHPSFLEIELPIKSPA